MEYWELAARESIRDLVARYNANGDSGRFGPMLELFTEDALMEVPQLTCRGRESIRTFFEDVAGGTGRDPGARAAFIRHFTAMHQIDVENEDAARGRCYYVVLTDRGLDHWGRYMDQYRRIAGRWLFSHRKVMLDGSIENAWASRD